MTNSFRDLNSKRFSWSGMLWCGSDKNISWAIVSSTWFSDDTSPSKKCISTISVLYYWKQTSCLSSITAGTQHCLRSFFPIWFCISEFCPSRCMLPFGHRKVCWILPNSLTLTMAKFYATPSLEVCSCIIKRHIFQGNIWRRQVSADNLMTWKSRFG